MRDASDQPSRTIYRCQCCGRDIVISVEGLFSNPQPGSARRFCDPACRQAAYRRRRAGVAETTPAQRNGGRDRTLRSIEEVAHRHGQTRSGLNARRSAEGVRTDVALVSYDAPLRERRF